MFQLLLDDGVDDDALVEACSTDGKAGKGYVWHFGWNGFAAQLLLFSFLLEFLLVILICESLLNTSAVTPPCLQDDKWEAKYEPLDSGWAWGAATCGQRAASRLLRSSTPTGLCERFFLLVANIAPSSKASSP